MTDVQLFLIMTGVYVGIGGATVIGMWYRREEGLTYISDAVPIIFLWPLFPFVAICEWFQKTRLPQPPSPKLRLTREELERQIDELLAQLNERKE